MAANTENSRVLILGGTGFIGRNLVHYLVSNNLASKVRVADKVPPQMAWMNKIHKDAFASPVVEFKHSNLINPASVSSVFTDETGNYDYVINLAAETKYGQSDNVYREGIVRLGMNCAEEAARRNVKLYIEISSGQMYSSDKKPANEDLKPDPWTHVAKYKLQVENQLSHVTGLKYRVIRPGIVYGVGDKCALGPRIIIGAIYKYIRQRMK
ncbi:dTDP-D-glucose 4,6-dehydratase-like [Ruditapes philippinarum]|uniref:dTDP-D-glucose 4,6-dehydratase-like n=1 Tax=Ruditapes philippinarum TaxID=129788 RepID=UPI00295B69AE|nr:dTDP-D-glucose 4,6-dehydratase-like [Ruditapes philippinarum]